MRFFESTKAFLTLPFVQANYREKRRRTLAALTADALLLVLALIFGTLLTVLPSLPPFDVVTDYRPKIPLRVYNADGALIGEFG